MTSIMSPLSHTILFADDTTIFFESDIISVMYSIVCTELYKYCKWFTANQLSLNVDKSNYIVLAHKVHFHCNQHLQMNGKEINKVDSTNFLRVYIESNWNDHILSPSSTIAQHIGIISKLYSSPAYT